MLSAEIANTFITVSLVTHLLHTLIRHNCFIDPFTTETISGRKVTIKKKINKLRYTKLSKLTS